MATQHQPYLGSPISPRERQIIAGLARGRTNTEIGDDLELSRLTVKSHLSRIARKLGVGLRAGIVGVAYRDGQLASLPVELRERVMLSAREKQVLDGMARGLNNLAIGRELFLSEDTIKSHARRIFCKLGARDRAHAVALAYQHGYLPLAQPVGRAA